MLPLTAYALLNISEKVAQNERSIFTFLANDEKGSLVNLIENGADELPHGQAKKECFAVSANLLVDFDFQLKPFFLQI